MYLLVVNSSLGLMILLLFTGVIYLYFIFIFLLIITQIIYLVWGPTMYQASVSHKDKDVKVDLKTYLKVYIQSVN